MTKLDVNYIWKDLLQAVYWFDESLQLHNKHAGFPQMSRTKSLILLSVTDGLERPIQIAERLGLTRQAISLALKELENDGLISIEADPHDSRATRVFFADEDKRDEMRKFARNSLYRIEEILAKRVGKKNFETFRAVLQQDWGEVVSPETKNGTGRD